MMLAKMLKTLMLLWTSLMISHGLAANVRGKELYVPLINEGETEPACAQGRNYCEHVDNYPKDTIMKLLQRFNDVPRELINFIFDENFDKFGYESRGADSQSSLPLNMSMESGYQERKEEKKQLCEATPLIIRPVVAKNHRNEWLYIVNVDGHSQYLHAELCQSDGNTCSTNLYERIGICHQEHRMEDLLALDPSGKMLKPYSFVVNSCCKCMLYVDPNHW